MAVMLRFVTRSLFRLPHALLPRPSESLELVFTGVVHVVALGVPTLNVLHLGWLPGPSLASLAHVCDRSDFFSCVCTVYWSVCLSAADCPASFPSELVYYWTSWFQSPTENPSLTRIILMRLEGCGTTRPPHVSRRTGLP